MGNILNISKRKAIDKIDSLGNELFTNLSENAQLFNC